MIIKYRIITNGTRYKPQRKFWLFWINLSNDLNGTVINIDWANHIINTHRNRIQRLLDDKKLYNNNAKGPWTVIKD